LKELAWKASMWVTASWVRIPSSLQYHLIFSVLRFFYPVLHPENNI
jgi:hypothetical protein